MLNRIAIFALSVVAACAEPTSELSSELCTPQDAESGLCIPSWVQTRARNESRAEVVRVTGFSDEYVLDPIVDGAPLSRTAQIRMLGNSVPPDIVAALVSASFPRPMGAGANLLEAA